MQLPSLYSQALLTTWCQVLTIFLLWIHKAFLIVAKKLILFVYVQIIIALDWNMRQMQDNEPHFQSVFFAILRHLLVVLCLCFHARLKFDWFSSDFWWARLSNAIQLVFITAIVIGHRININSTKYSIAQQFYCFCKRVNWCLW